MKTAKQIHVKMIERRGFVNFQSALSEALDDIQKDSEIVDIKYQMKTTIIGCSYSAMIIVNKTGQCKICKGSGRMLYKAKSGATGKTVCVCQSLI